MIIFFTLAVCFAMVDGNANQRIALESKQTLPHNNGWIRTGTAKKTDYINLVFALKQRNTDQLEKLFWSVSEPTSPDYGQHLSLEEIASLVRPDPRDIQEVLRWLVSYKISPDRSCSSPLTQDFLKCRMSVRTAELLLETEFSYFTSPRDDHVIIRAHKTYSVPYRVARALDFVGGLHRVPNDRRSLKVKERVALNSQDSVRDNNQFSDEHSAAGYHSFRYGVHPDTLRKQYKVGSAVGGAGANNSQATAQFLGQHYSPSDLKEFMMFFGRGFPHSNEVDHVVGPNSGKAGLEANLDVQYLMALGANITTTFWSTGGLHEGQEPFLEWMLDLSNSSDIPYIFSVSYGDYERTLSVEYMRRINREFQKAGLRGVSILFASGDGGAGCYRSEDGSVTFEPEFPSTSPFVTAVGGTRFTSMFSDTNEQANDISGGGFSSVFKMPPYQKELVAHYLNTTELPDAKHFDPTKRAFPDLAALSDNFWIIIHRLVMNVAGTSAATPTVAGIFALLNDARLAAGKPVLGFLNPLIYRSNDAFTDITTGSNSEACWLEDLEGYNVAEGWDPVTGVGTPDFAKLLAVILS